MATLGLALLTVPLWHLWWSDVVVQRAQEQAVVRTSERLEDSRSAE